MRMYVLPESQAGPTHRSADSGRFLQCIIQVQYSSLTGQHQYHCWQQLVFCFGGLNEQC